MQFLSYVISKSSSFLSWKNFELIFAALYFYILWAQKVSQIFKILFQTGDINIFVLCGVFFSRYVQLKSSFSDQKKYQRWNLRHFLVDKLSKINTGKLIRQSIKRKFHHWRKLELCKVLHSANYTENANEDVPLKVENVWYF